MYKYADSGQKIGIQILTKALKRLGDLLCKENKRLELTCCGGIISLMYFQSRTMTQDVDAIFPAREDNKNLLKKLIKQVGEEMGLAVDGSSMWFNDGVSFFGLETRSDVVIFKHPCLVLKAASWEELFAHKVKASRDEQDIEDAMHLLGEIRGKSKEDVYKAVEKYAPVSPHLRKDKLRQQFENIWGRALGHAHAVPH